MAARRYQLTYHKRGDRFLRRIEITAGGQPVDLSGMEAAAEVRSFDFDALSTLTVDMSEAASGVVTVYLSDTSSWPISDEDRPCLCDIRFDTSSGEARTETLGIVVLREVTA